MSPNTGLSPHERARRAFGAYTLCLTNYQEYFRCTFPNYESFSFRFTEASIQERVADVIAHPKQYTDLGIDVAETFQNGQDTDDTARYLLDMANMLRLETSQSVRGLQTYFAWPPRTTSSVPT
jgi:hypothetical protein